MRDQAGISLTHLDGGYARFEAENDAAAQAVLARALTGSADGTQVLRFGKLTPSLAQIFKEVVK